MFLNSLNSLDSPNSLDSTRLLLARLLASSMLIWAVGASGVSWATSVHVLRNELRATSADRPANILVRRSSEQQVHFPEALSDFQRRSKIAIVLSSNLFLPWRWATPLRTRTSTTSIARGGLRLHATLEVWRRRGWSGRARGFVSGSELLEIRHQAAGAVGRGVLHFSRCRRASGGPRETRGRVALRVAVVATAAGGAMGSDRVGPIGSARERHAPQCMGARARRQVGLSRATRTRHFAHGAAACHVAWWLRVRMCKAQHLEQCGGRFRIRRSRAHRRHMLVSVGATCAGCGFLRFLGRVCVCGGA